MYIGFRWLRIIGAEFSRFTDSHIDVGKSKENFTSGNANSYVRDLPRLQSLSPHRDMTPSPQFNRRYIDQTFVCNVLFGGSLVAFSFVIGMWEMMFLGTYKLGGRGMKSRLLWFLSKLAIPAKTE
ncbi:hypothetical protein Bhyg_09970 [Pseudolycoriella hygida]|uniref:Uncharacterized protein n=1 Tax=Pseudolycoriella hygida TaxID=35572 RepID=A0A9Q0MSJ8_9DIPT|nr:hypothetical protein Bhyg_09970 [Pseudolycoriella hygida]